MSALFKQNITKHLLYFISLQVFSWIVLLILNSIAAFFHFQLGHSIGVLENWVYDQKWTIATIVSLISSFIFVKLITIHSSNRRPFRELIIGCYKKPRSDLFVIIILNLVFYVYLGNVVLEEKVYYEIVMQIHSYIGHFTLMFSNILIIITLESVFPLKRRERFIQLIIFPFIIYYFSKELYSLNQTFGKTLFIQFFLAQYLVRWRGLNWTYPLAITLLCFAPINTILGMDIIWGSEISALRPTHAPETVSLLVITFVSILYLELKKLKQS